MSLDLDIQNAFSGMQLILIFVTILFGIRYQQIQNELERDYSEINKLDKLKTIDSELKQKLITHCLPLVIINGFVIFLFYKIFKQILVESGYYFWNYNFIQSSFFFVTIMIIIFFIWSIILSLKMFKHREIISKREKEIIANQNKIKKGTKSLINSVRN